MVFSRSLGDIRLKSLETTSRSRLDVALALGLYTAWNASCPSNSAVGKVFNGSERSFRIANTQPTVLDCKRNNSLQGRGRAATRAVPGRRAAGGGRGAA
jgi:hypothetical protein